MQMAPTKNCSIKCWRYYYQVCATFIQTKSNKVSKLRCIKCIQFVIKQFINLHAHMVKCKLHVNINKFLDEFQLMWLRIGIKGPSKGV